LNNNVLFRVNAGDKNGLGHLSRCITISNSLKKLSVQSFFLIKTDNKVKINNYLENKDLNYHFIEKELSLEEDVELIISFYKLKFSFLVLDHYDHDFDYQMKIKKAGVKWAQFDNKAKDRILADIVINLSVTASDSLYKELTEDNAILCIGYKYAIIENPINYIDTNLKKEAVLIAMGGGVYPDEVLNMILTITSHNENYFEVITTDERLPNLLNEKSNVKVHLNTKDVWSIYKKCFAAIVAGGMTTFELASLNIPMLIIPYAENQKANANAWELSGFGKYIDSPMELILMINNNSLESVLKDCFSNLEMKISIDSLGSKRLSDKIFQRMKNL